uniref:tropomyosin-2-like n=1 Tax=Styela clava TaxID=7725 RepID=UPI00193A2C55|nr:tropomyosin-2-like [Styela clava]
MDTIRRKLQEFTDKIESKDGEINDWQTQLEEKKNSLREVEAKAKASEEKCNLKEAELRKLEISLREAKAKEATVTKYGNEETEKRLSTNSQGGIVHPKLQELNKIIAALTEELTYQRPDLGRRIIVLKRDKDELEKQVKKWKNRVDTLEQTVKMIKDKVTSMEKLAILEKFTEDQNTLLEEEMMFLEGEVKELDLHYNMIKRQNGVRELDIKEKGAELQSWIAKQEALVKEMEEMDSASDDD